jgi:hypothetical protein
LNLVFRKSSLIVNYCDGKDGTKDF